MVDDKSIDKYLKKTVNELEHHYSGKENDNDYHTALTGFLNEYLNNGKSTFEYTCLVFGSKSVVSFNLINIHDYFASYFTAKQACIFYQMPTLAAFTSVINAYSYYIILFLESQKINSFGLLNETDITLTAFFASVYSPKSLVPVSQYLLSFLENERMSDVNYIRPRKGNFGRNNILILLVEVLKFYNHFDISGSISEYCHQESKPFFKSAIDITTSVDENIFKDYIDNLLTFHIDNSKSIDYTFPFHSAQWQFFPIEIIVLFHIRKSCGLSLNISKNFIFNLFIPFIDCGYFIDKEDFTNQLLLKCLNELY